MEMAIPQPSSRNGVPRLPWLPFGASGFCPAVKMCFGLMSRLRRSNGRYCVLASSLAVSFAKTDFNAEATPMIGTRAIASISEAKKSTALAMKIQSGRSCIFSRNPAGNIANSDTSDVVMQKPIARTRTPGPSEGICGESKSGGEYGFDSRLSSFTGHLFADQLSELVFRQHFYA